MHTKMHELGRFGGHFAVALNLGPRVTETPS